MPNFAYKARLATGAITDGVIEAPDTQTAIGKLRSQKLTILEINEAAESPLAVILAKIPFLKPTVKSKDLVLFSRQMSTLVSAGVPLVQGLNIIEEQIENKTFRAVVKKVRTDIEGGISIAEALQKHPDAFSELYVSMVKAGEIGGILDVILERLSAYLEATEALRSKVKGAMVYPAVVSFVAASVTIFLLVFVIPTFKDIFASFGGELPLPTQILINLSEFLKKNILGVISAPIVAFIAFKRYRKTERGQRLVDNYVLKLPVFGMLLKKVAIAKMTRTLGTLVKSGVPILQAMETVATTSGNKIVEDAITSSKKSIKEGERISEPLKRSGVFPPMVTQMISIGEETGNLDTMLTKIADFYDEEVDTAVKALTSMIEPIIIVVMGLVIGTIVIAMFMPMFEMGQLASKQG